MSTTSVARWDSRSIAAGGRRRCEGVLQQSKPKARKARKRFWKLQGGTEGDKAKACEVSNLVVSNQLRTEVKHEFSANQEGFVCL